MSNFYSFSLDQWLDYIQRQHWRTMDLKLDRVSEVWTRLGGGRPPLVITVAGTNGKGSCVAMLESIFGTAGHRTGSYTSPHLVRYNERICIDGKPVDDVEIMEAFQCIEVARKGIGLTYFEFGTLCALLLFQDHHIEVAILEVGMGGRLDAVNMIDNDLALITSVGLDHQQWLGWDREQIGKEKAGVITPGAYVVSADPAPPVTIAATAMERQAVLLQNEKHYYIESEGKGHTCRWWSEHPAVPEQWRHLTELLPCFPGDWQVRNLGGVIASLALLSRLTRLAPEHIVPGLSAARLSGRCQVVDTDPLTILDVAHNTDSAAALACFLDDNWVPGRTHAVFGILADKALDTVVEDIGKRVDCWHLAGIAEARGQSGEMLAEKMRSRFPDQPMTAYHNTLDAYQCARVAAGPDGRVVVFGSFFIISDIISSFENG